MNNSSDFSKGFIWQKIQGQFKSGKKGLFLFLFVPILFFLSIGIYFANTTFYWNLTNEDGLLEWSTFFSLFATGLLSLVLAIRLKKNHLPYFWFFLLFSAFGFFCAMEEISWGQRVLDVESTEFFVKNSTQGETNIHNVFQKWGRSIPLIFGEYNFKTKHLAGLSLFVFGSLMPLFARNRSVSKFLEKFQIAVPPPVLSLSFFLAALMMIDKPTGREEEIGEFLFSVCLLLFVIVKFQEKSGPAKAG